MNAPANAPSSETRDHKGRVETLAHAATIFAAVFAVVTFGAGLSQFNKTQYLARETLAHERESKAVELFLKFNETMQSRSKEPIANKEQLFWSDNALLALTESVYKLTAPDDGWIKTARWMLSQQREFLEREQQGCDTFLEPFVAMMKSAAPMMKCTQ